MLKLQKHSRSVRSVYKHLWSISGLLLTSAGQTSKLIHPTGFAKWTEFPMCWRGTFDRGWNPSVKMYVTVPWKLLYSAAYPYRTGIIRYHCVYWCMIAHLYPESGNIDWNGAFHLIYLIYLSQSRGSLKFDITWLWLLSGFGNFENVWYTVCQQS